jgi:hypothetical protein
MSTADRTTERSPRPGAQQAATHRTLSGIIRVGAARQREYQSRGNETGSDQPPHHFVPFRAALVYPPVYIGWGRVQLVGERNVLAQK